MFYIFGLFFIVDALGSRFGLISRQEPIKRTMLLPLCQCQTVEVAKGDEAQIRGGELRYVRRTLDAMDQVDNLCPTALRDVKRARAFLNEAIEPVRPHRPVTIAIDKAQGYRSVIPDDQPPLFFVIPNLDREHISGRVRNVRRFQQMLKREVGQIVLIAHPDAAGCLNDRFGVICHFFHRQSLYLLIQPIR